MEILLGAAIVLLLVLVPVFVGWPVFRRKRGTGEEVNRADAELAELEARKDAKYREIRDAEADRAAGKLSDEDFQRLDRELRREAIEILKRIDRLRGPGGAGNPTV
jgi:type II secretory pathway component PulM